MSQVNNQYEVGGAGYPKEGGFELSAAEQRVNVLKFADVQVDISMGETQLPA